MVTTRFNPRYTDDNDNVNECIVGNSVFKMIRT
jgi:hypothetical protein